MAVDTVYMRMATGLLPSVWLKAKEGHKDAGNKPESTCPISSPVFLTM